MIKHILKLVWNRKRANGLLMVEVFFSFLVLVALVTIGVYVAGIYGEPLGFTYERVVRVDVDTGVETDDEWDESQVETMRAVLEAARRLNGVEAVAGALFGPFVLGGSSYETTAGGRPVEIRHDEVTDDVAAVLGLKLVQGRWFGPEDNGQNWLPVVATKPLVDLLFPDENPLGKNLAPEGASREWRIVGVSTAYRADGEFQATPYFFFQRARLDDPSVRPPSRLLLKLRTAVTAAYEEEVLHALQAVAREWSFDVVALEESRDARHNLFLIPYTVFAVVVWFLLLMVGLGLAGVLWQSVTARTAEIGLRRAVGGTAADVRRQILGELAVVTTLGLGFGTFLFLQVPLLGVFDLPWRTYALGWIVAAGILYGFVVLCGLYPSWLATRVHPSEALHYE